MAATGYLELSSYGTWPASGSNRRESSPNQQANITQAADMISLSDAILQGGEVTHDDDAARLLPTDFVLQEVCDGESEDVSSFCLSSTDSQDSWTLDGAMDDSDMGSNIELPVNKGPAATGVGNLKEHLRNKIHLRRLSEGRSLPQVLFEEPKVYQLTGEELQKQKRRRERNRISANKSRLKRIGRQKSLEQDATKLENENQKFRNEIARLSRLKSTFKKLLQSHVCIHGTARRNGGGPRRELKRNSNSNVLHDICGNQRETGTYAGKAADCEKIRNVTIVTTRQAPFTVGSEARIPSSSGIVHTAETGRQFSDNNKHYSVPTTTEMDIRQSREEIICANRNSSSVERGDDVLWSGHRRRQHSSSAGNKKVDEMEGDENMCIAIIKQDLEESTKSLWSC